MSAANESGKSGDAECLGRAYSVWIGIGAIEIAMIGMLPFGESAYGLRLLSIGIVLPGFALYFLWAAKKLAHSIINQLPFPGVVRPLAYESANGT